MGKLSQYARNRVISLRMANNSIVNIVRILQEEDGIKTFFATCAIARSKTKSVEVFSVILA
jgi:hypothetical protein